VCISGPKNPAKPSPSIGYVTESPEDIQLSLKALTLEEKEEPLGLDIMDNNGPTILGDSNYGRWRIEMMTTLEVHNLDKVVTVRNQQAQTLGNTRTGKRRMLRQSSYSGSHCRLEFSNTLKTAKLQPRFSSASWI
jgi:hypothetical protein